MTERFKIVYRDWGYAGRTIHSRDRAWLEFVPKGEEAPERYMFQSTTLLEDNDPEIDKALVKEGKEVDLSCFDVYSVYRTTCG